MGRQKVWKGGLKKMNGYFENNIFYWSRNLDILKNKFILEICQRMFINDVRKTEQGADNFAANQYR